MSVGVSLTRAIPSLVMYIDIDVDSQCILSIRLYKPWVSWSMNQRLIDSLCACVLACVMSCQVVAWYGVKWKRAGPCSNISWHTMVVSQCHSNEWYSSHYVHLVLWSSGPIVVLLYCNRIDIVQCGWMMGRDLYALCRHAESMGDTRYYWRVIHYGQGVIWHGMMSSGII
jgi:hypothetical protein